MLKESIRLRTGDREAQATRNPDKSGAVSVTLDGGDPFFVEAIGPDTFRVTRGNRTSQAAAIAQGDRRWVFLDGHVVIIEVYEGARRRQSRGGGVQSLTAPMPATVTKLLASENQHAKKGDTLLLLEAMKMELPIRAPADGVVKKVRCREGQLVQPDTLLIDFE